jgi:hypothetical protein
MEINEKLKTILSNVITLVLWLDIDEDNEDYIYCETLKIHSHSFKVDIESSSYGDGGITGCAEISILTSTMEWKTLFEIPYLQTNISIVNFPKGRPPLTREEALRIFKKDRDDLITIGYALISNVGNNSITEIGTYGNTEK